MFDNFFRTFDGRHLLLLVALAAIVTVIVILRSPKAPGQSQADASSSVDFRAFVTQYQRGVMLDFLLNALGFGPDSDEYKNVREAADKHDEYYELHAVLREACRRLSIDAEVLGNQNDQGYEAWSTLVDDKEFVTACASLIGFIAHLTELAFTVNTPAGRPINERGIPSNRDITAYRQFVMAIKARREQTEVYEQYTSFTQRAVVASFVANILGYGHNAYAYLRLQQTLDEGNPVRLRLTDAIENVIRKHALTKPDWTSLTDSRLESLLANDRGFVLSCAYDINAITALADLAHSLDNKPRNLHAPEDNPLAAFRALRAHLWSSEDVTYEEPRSGQ